MKVSKTQFERPLATPTLDGRKNDVERRSHANTQSVEVAGATSSP